MYTCISIYAMWFICDDHDYNWFCWQRIRMFYFIFLSRLYFINFFYSNAVHKFPVYGKIKCYCIVLYIVWHRAVSYFIVPSTPLLISSEGMSSVPSYLPVFTSACTSHSVPPDCPHFQWRAGWLAVWICQCRAHSSTCYRSILSTSPVLHHSMWSADYISIIDDRYSLLVAFREAI